MSSNPFSSLPPGMADAMAEIAQRHGFSPEAAAAMLDALRRSGGSMAQFSHPEFGGAGQWMRGGMTMVADLFNQQLASRVDALASQLGEWLASVAAAPGASGAASSGWWPPGLGQPASSGAQDGMRYAFFPDVRRLVVDAGGQVTVYDSGEHRIGGVSQQQGGSSSVRFTSQLGDVDLGSLPVVQGPEGTVPRAPHAATPRDNAATPPAFAETGRPVQATARPSNGTADGLLATIEKLADLAARGILTADEYAAKKAELLGRL